MLRYLTLLFLVVSSPVLAKGDDHSVYGYKTTPETWGVFTLHTPAGRWNVTKDIQSERATFRLESTSSNKVILQLAFSRGLPKEDAHYDNNPHLVNNAALLSVASKLANQDDSRVVISVGTAATPEYVGTSSRATVLLDDNRAANVEATHFMVRDDEQSHLAVGIVLTESVRGQVNQEADYVDRVAEAFAIIQAIEVNLPNAVQ